MPKNDRDQYMSEKHLSNIRQMPSCISKRIPCEAHHLRYGPERGVGMKATDRWAVPLTHEEHIQVHMVGGKKEEEWFAERGVACYALASALWHRKDDPEGMRRIIMEGKVNGQHRRTD